MRYLAIPKPDDFDVAKTRNKCKFITGREMVIFYDHDPDLKSTNVLKKI